MNVQINKLKSELEEYDVIYVFNSLDREIKRLLDVFLHGYAKFSSKKILILGFSVFNEHECKGKYKVITKEYYNEINKLYRSYEFSDKIQMIVNSKQYGSILNYLSTGILSEEEFFEALLR